jgi:hypothetical protein
MLLQKKAYQKRTLFGEEYLRALLVQPEAADGTPSYLPAPVGKKLPLVQKMSCRVLAEVEARQDEYEKHSAALRVLALARVT